MNIKPHLLAFLLTFFYLNVSAQKEKDLIFPTTPFDKVLTENALAPGKSTLHGVIKRKIENPQNTLLGIDVELYPCTPYFSEWLELSKNNKKRKKIVVFSSEAYTYRILAKASDQDGTFEFKNLKPGKYYLQATVTEGKSLNYSVKVGDKTTTGYNMYNQIVSQYTKGIYESRRGDYNVSHVVTTIAEITSDGQVVNLEL